MEENIIMASTRERIPKGSKNSSRKSSVSSTISSKPYHEHIEIQNLDPSWFDQVENKCFPLFLSTNVGKSNISNSLGTGNNSKSM